MRANRFGQGFGDGALPIHGDAGDGQAQSLRRRSEAGKRQGFGQHAVAGTAEKAQDAEDCGLATGENGHALDREAHEARREPADRLLQLRLPASRPVVVQKWRESCAALDRR